MKPDFFDTYNSGDLRLPNPTDDYPSRGSSFPLFCADKDSIGEYVMQLPKRFDKIWVITPIEDFSDYSNRFMNEAWPKFKDEIIRPNKSDVNGSSIPDRPYSWFYEVFMGNSAKKPLFPLLVMVNESGEQDFDCFLVDKILAHGDIHFIDLWCCHSDERMIFAKQDLPLWLTFLRSHIQTVLVTEQEMERNAPGVIKGLIRRNPDDTIENLSEVMEALGCYLSDDLNDSVDPKILICPKRIRKVAKDLNIDSNILFCIVYVHELAHAAMDYSIDAIETQNNPDTDCCYCLKKADNQYKFDDSSDFMEESLANMIMLKYLEWYSEVEEDTSLFDIVERFVSQQSSMYKFGLIQMAIDADWTKWRKYKAKNNVANDKLKKWFNNYHDNSPAYTKQIFEEIFL